MSRRRLLALFAAALIITVAIAVSAQAPPVTTSEGAGYSNVPTNQSIKEVAAARLSEENIMKIQTSKTNLTCQTPALVELNNGGVSANVDAGITSL